jgi:hypothetical protein
MGAYLAEELQRSHRHTDHSVFVHINDHCQLDETALNSHSDLSGREHEYRPGVGYAYDTGQDIILMEVSITGVNFLRMTVMGGGERSCTCLVLITDYSTVVFSRATKLACAGSEART